MTNKLAAGGVVRTNKLAAGGVVRLTNDVAADGSV